MTHEELEEAVPLYATGALDRSERQVFEAHLLSGCASCHTALKEYQSVASLLPFGLSPMQAPRPLKAKIMAARNPDPLAVDSLPKETSRPSLEPGEWMNHLFPPITPASSLSLPWAIGVGTLLLVGIGGYLAWNYSTRVSQDASRIQQLETSLQEQSETLTSLQREMSTRDRTLARLQSDLANRSVETAELKDRLVEHEMELETARLQLSTTVRRGRPLQDDLAILLRQPHANVVTLTGSDVAKQAAGIFLHDPRTQKGWFYSANLPECPRGTTYQVWAVEDKPVSIGTFHVGAGQNSHLFVKRLPAFGKARAFAVSLEPIGGRSQPTGPIYLISPRS